MALIQIRSTYENPQPYGDPSTGNYGTVYEIYNWYFDTDTITVEKTYAGLQRDEQNSNPAIEYNYAGEFFSRCVGSTREGYTSDNQGSFTVIEEANSNQCSILVLDFVSATDETSVAGDDGTTTIQASGGVEPFTAMLVDLSMEQPAAAGQPNTFSSLPSNRYTLRVTDSSRPIPQVVEGSIQIKGYSEPHAGCLDGYATDYDPTATSAGACSYAPLWRSAWGPTGMAVEVPAIPGQLKGYVGAQLFIGFRPGHPLASVRPLGEPITLRGTVSPGGYASFKLAPYLWAELGAVDETGGRRLDLNSPTAYEDDLYVGYELRRTTGELLEHGYALNSAVPDEAIAGDYLALSPFTILPVWPGFAYTAPTKLILVAPAFAGLSAELAEQYDTITLPCPSNPLPVAWLAPGSGYGYWVFQGRPLLGDDVGDGQTYNEAATSQRRYSDPGEARQTIKATSGIFGGDELLRGLRTLWRSTQAWYQPGGPDTEWIAITVERGQRDVGRLGVRRQELAVSFSHAAPEWAQGQ